MEVGGAGVSASKLGMVIFSILLVSSTKSFPHLDAFYFFLKNEIISATDIRNSSLISYFSKNSSLFIRVLLCKNIFL